MSDQIRRAQPEGQPEDAPVNDSGVGAPDTEPEEGEEPATEPVTEEE